MSDTPQPSLSGVTIGAFHILDRGPNDNSHHTQYWIRHECGAERLAKARNLRKGIRGEWEPRCSRCGQ